MGENKKEKKRAKQLKKLMQGLSTPATGISAKTKSVVVEPVPTAESQRPSGQDTTPTGVVQPSPMDVAKTPIERRRQSLASGEVATLSCITGNFLGVECKNIFFTILRDGVAKDMAIDETMDAPSVYMAVAKYGEPQAARAEAPVARVAPVAKVVTAERAEEARRWQSRWRGLRNRIAEEAAEEAADVVTDSNARGLLKRRRRAIAADDEEDA